MKYIALIVFISALVFLGFIPEQQDFSLIICGFSAAFGAYLLLISKTGFSTKHLIYVGIAVRVAMIFAYPNLSDDIYRFIWDGSLLHLGENPFLYLPSEYVETASNTIFRELYPLLNSPEYYSIYPPFAQAVFFLSTFSWMNSAVIIKLLLLLAEIGTIYYSLKLLAAMEMNSRNVLWYALNPLVIVEVMVNIHFEGFMVFFFVLFLYFLKVNVLNKAAVAIALAIGAKLVPLLFLPYFLFHWKLKKVMVFYSKIGAVLLVLFLPMLIQLGGFTESLDLYFRKFEFNASIYYLLREVGELWKGYNMIGKIGPWMAITVFSIVMYLAYKTKDFMVFCQWALLVFLLLSTTVHPWYLSLGILLSVFSNRKFFIAWSFLVVLSYSKYGMSEAWYYGLICLEYLLFLAYLAYELSLTEGRYSQARPKGEIGKPEYYQQDL